MLDFLHYIRECHAFYLTITLLVLLQYLLVGDYCFLVTCYKYKCLFSKYPIIHVMNSRIGTEDARKIKNTSNTKHGGFSCNTNH